MYIHEAVEKAVDIQGVIVRLQQKENTGHFVYKIQPTNSRDACRVLIVENDQTEKIVRWWNPTANDLMADDWEVIKE